MNCKSPNIVYGLDRNICGLVYVGDTEGKVHKRMCGGQPDIIKMCII
jgi:hypothetical protein